MAQVAHPFFKAIQPYSGMAFFEHWSISTLQDLFREKISNFLPGLGPASNTVENLQELFSHFHPKSRLVRWRDNAPS
jgi:hypothetical protein